MVINPSFPFNAVIYAPWEAPPYRLACVASEYDITSTWFMSHKEQNVMDACLKTEVWMCLASDPYHLIIKLLQLLPFICI